MNFFGYDKVGMERTTKLQKEAAVEAIVRANGKNSTGHTVAQALRHLAESIDRQQVMRRAVDEVSQPTLQLAMREA